MAENRFVQILRRPFSQNLVVASMLFCLPGMYNAITGLGAGGGKPSSLEVANNVNAIIYIMLAFGSLVVGSILALLKPRLCLVLGAVGYPFYVGGLWYYDRTAHNWLVYLSGVTNGISGAFLWTTSSFVQFCYPEEKQKGKYIAIQWGMRSAGATVGAFIAFGANFHQNKAVGVSNGLYVVFIVIQLVALLAAITFVVDPRQIVRKDGTHIAVFTQPSITVELKTLFKAAVDFRYLMLTLPMFCCEMALGLVSSINSRSFNLRTRALNNVAFNAVQIFMPPILTSILDNKRIGSRRLRALGGLALTGPIAICAAAGALAWARIHNIDQPSEPRAWDWTDSPWKGLLAFYLMFGCTYAGFQMVTEYTLSATTNDPERLSKIAGLFKFYSSLGMFLSFILAGQNVAFSTQAGIQLGCYVLSVFAMGYIIWNHIPVTNYFSETNVIAPLESMQAVTLEGCGAAEVIEQTASSPGRVLGDAKSHVSAE